MLIFGRKKKEQLPEKTPKWFMYLMCGAALYMLISAMFNDKPLKQIKAKHVSASEQAIDFQPLFSTQWGNQPAPFHVEIKQKGQGLPVQCWDSLALRYKLYNAKHEKKDDNFSSKESLHVMIGKKDIPPGFERGLLGMRQGELRHITAQANQAYGNTGFTHEGMQIADAAGWVVKLEAIRPPKFPSAVGFGYRSYDEKKGTGDLLQCTDKAHIRVQAYGLNGALLWQKPWEQSFDIGTGIVPYGIEKSAIGMNIGGKRTIILPAGYMKPLFAEAKNMEAFPLPENQDALLLLDIEALPL